MFGSVKNRQIYTESEIWSYDFWSSHRQTEINWHITCHAYAQVGSQSNNHEKAAALTGTKPF